jgi:hypothetical protein
MLLVIPDDVVLDKFLPWLDYALLDNSI